MRKVVFRVHAPEAKSVYLVGSFNDWDIEDCPMKKENGNWVVSLELPPGVYEYRYLIDGGWYTDPHRPQVFDGWGENSILEIEKDDRSLISI